MTAIILTGKDFGIKQLVEIAREDVQVVVPESVTARLRKAREILESAAASGQQIYGMNTGLGANLNTAVTDELASFQVQLIRGRGMAVGAPFKRDVSRGIMAARLAMLSVGGSGISESVYHNLVQMLNAGVHPLMPSLGSIGAGDLVQLAAMARGLIGEGDAEFRGNVLPAKDALSLAGLNPAVLKPKDGISLLNASAVSVGEGALAIHDASNLLIWQRRAAALTYEALNANPAVLDPELQTARVADGQAVEAEALRELLWGSALFENTTAIQDPLSVRCVASINGALSTALIRAREVIELELNSAADNPVVLLEEGRVQSSGNFHTPSLALAFETLGLAVAQAAAASSARFVQLTGSSRNGLPRYLSQTGGASAGFVPLQKTVAALQGAIRHKANPVMLDYMPVSEGVEDHATQSALTVRKLSEMLELWTDLIACELLAAAQAVELREGHRCGAGTQEIFNTVRLNASFSASDRPLGDDVAGLSEFLRRSVKRRLI